MVNAAQHKLFFHYFGIKGLALAYGLEQTVNKVTLYVAAATAVPISEDTGTYVSVFWVPVALGAVSLLPNIASPPMFLL